MKADHTSTSTGRAVEEALPRVLIVTAVEAEREAVLRGLRGSSRFHVIAAGAGTAAAAAGTAAALAAGSYGCVISAGIGGGFPGRAPVGSLALASEMIAADLGAETPEGFRSAAELGFGRVSVPGHSGTVQAVAAALAAAGLYGKHRPCAYRVNGDRHRRDGRRSGRAASRCRRGGDGRPRGCRGRPASGSRRWSCARSRTRSARATGRRGKSMKPWMPSRPRLRYYWRCCNDNRTEYCLFPLPQ